MGEAGPRQSSTPRDGVWTCSGRTFRLPGWACASKDVLPWDEWDGPLSLDQRLVPEVVAKSSSDRGEEPRCKVIGERPYPFSIRPSVGSSVGLPTAAPRRPDEALAPPLLGLGLGLGLGGTARCRGPWRNRWVSMVRSRHRSRAGVPPAACAARGELASRDLPQEPCASGASARMRGEWPASPVVVTGPARNGSGSTPRRGTMAASPKLTGRTGPGLR